MNRSLSLLFIASALSIATTACGGATAASTTSTSTDPATTGDPTSGATATTGSTSTSTASTGTTSSSTTSPTPTRRRRATIDPTRLDTCTPEAASLVVVGPATATFSTTLGGCAFITYAPPPPNAPQEVLFDVFAEVSPIRESLLCNEGHPAQVDFEHNTYGTLSSVHSSADHWEVVWAVDDGQQVHVGARLARTCQGVPPSMVRTLEALEVASPDRAVTLHRCAPLRTSCGNVP